MSKVVFLIPWCVTKRELLTVFCFLFFFVFLFLFFGFFWFFFWFFFCFFCFFFSDSWAQFLKVGHDSDKSSSWVT